MSTPTERDKQRTELVEAIKAIDELSYANLPQADIEATKIMARVLEFRDPEVESRALLMRGAQLWMSGKTDEAGGAYERALLIAEAPEQDFHFEVICDLKMRALAGLGVVEWRRDNLTKCLEYHFFAANEARKISDHAFEAECELRVASVYDEQGSIEDALTHYSTALKYSRKNTGDSSYLDVLINHASLCEDIDDYASAKYFIDEGLETGLAKSSRYHRSILLAMLSKCYQAHDDFAQAIEIAQQAVNSASQLGSHPTTSYVISVLGYLQIEQGNTDEGIPNLEIAFAGLEKDGLRAKTSAVLAKGYSSLVTKNASPFLQSKVDEWLHLAEQLLTKTPQRLKSDTLKVMECVYELTGDALKAHAASKERHSVFRALYPARVKSQLISMRFALEKERDAHEKEMQRLKAEHLERELRLTAIQLGEHADALTKFQNDLKAIVRSMTDPIETLRNVSKRINEMPAEAADWQKFEAEFTAAHPEFKIKLQQAYPELSPAEVRVCALLRLNLKTSEMSRLLYLSERTIENQRASIRKKLGLNRQDSISEVLLKL